MPKDNSTSRGNKPYPPPTGNPQGNSKQRKKFFTMFVRIRNIPAKSREEEPTEKRTGPQRLLEFLEQPLFINPLAVVGGLVGMFLFTPLLAIVGVCIVLAFHRNKTVSDKSKLVQIVAYGILFIAVIVGLYAIGSLIKKNIPQLATRQEIAELFSKMSPRQTPTPITTQSPLPALHHNKIAEPFVVELLGSMFSEDRDHGCGFWVRYKGAHGDTVSPANVALYLRIANAQAVPVTITSYTIESKNANGQWIRLFRIPTIATLPYYGIDLQRTMVFREDNKFLDRMLQSGPIKARQYVVGWSIYEYPKANSSYRFVPEYRITVEGALGEYYVKEIKAKGDQDAIQTPELSFAGGGFQDLSGLHKEYYSDPP
ncbi:MAG: hypothetical protein WA738_03755 [Candidatus Angelobacter sp.]